MTLNPPTSNDRFLAALAHAGILLPGLGLVAPLLVWRTVRQQNRTIAFQALQALGWQVLHIFYVQVVALILGLLYIIFAMIAGPLTSGMPAEKIGGLTTISGSVLVLMVFALIVAYIFVGLLGSVLCLMGRDFRYPWLGPKLADYLLVSPDITALNPEHEDRWLAALGHWGIFIPLTGMLTPLVVWLGLPDITGWLKRQSIQTVIYQAVGMVAGIIVQVFISLLVIPLSVVISLGLLSGQSSGDSTLALMIIGLLMLVFLALLVLLIPLYSLLGFIGGIRVLKGRDFNYPLLGRWIKPAPETRSAA